VETFWEWHPGAGGSGSAAVCGQGHAPGTVGDYVLRVNYTIGNLAAGKSKTVKVNYQRF
jgi:hypothetical protein